MADLHADKKFTIALGALDEMKNPTTFDGTIAFAIDRPDLVNLTDNSDGSAVVAAIGPLGTVLLTATITPTAGTAEERTMAINVIAGEAAGFAFTVGEEEEVTPDV